MTENPLMEYLTGVIIPKDFINTSIKEEEMDLKNEIITNSVYEDDDEDSFDEISSSIPSEIDPSTRSKSFGMSFFVESKNPLLDICITWARYSEIKDSTNKFVQSWKRKPYSFITTIDLNNVENCISFYDEKDGEIRLYVTVKSYEDSTYFVNLSVLNCLNLTKKNSIHVPSCIFQPTIRIKLNKSLDKNSKIPNFNEKNIMQKASKEKRLLDFIYSDRPIKAAGRMCSVIWEEVDYIDELGTEKLWPDGAYLSTENPEIKKFEHPDVRTEFVPLYPMPTSSFEIYDKNNNKLEFFANDLAESWEAEEFDEILNPLINLYENWIEENKKQKVKDDEDILKDIIKNQEIALTRMKQGLNIIKKDADARLAFCFANKAIYKQSEWSKPKGKPFSWRPFQIAFFLMNIESIVNEDSKARDTLDLLWISTGGGKTEAYLGIMAFTMALRRLKAIKYNETGAGTSIISRYTLRLLTVQQFRRTLKMVTAAEYLRVFKNNDNTRGWRPSKCYNNENWIYGSTRFSIGLWVGKRVTPINIRNKEDGAIKFLEKAIIGDEAKDKGEPAQVMRCPVCNSWISIPKNGIPKEDEEFHKLHLILDMKDNDFESLKSAIMRLNKPIEKIPYILDVLSSNKNHIGNNITVSIIFGNKDITPDFLIDLEETIKKFAKITSLNFFRPGYFGTLKSPKSKKIIDYEIYCTNPKCHLNHIEWEEGIPIEENSEQYISDKNYKRNIPNLPFKLNSRMVIPAYTVDEQIYTKCPTLIISTVDKIARLAFEPKAASLFGNVDVFNSYYGYFRAGDDNLLPDDYKKSFGVESPIKPLKSPDLIIQDELHLIDGPLGSLFGLYEATISAILSKKDIQDKKRVNPKYIASTATINNSKTQVKQIFAKELYQFPPHGLSIENNFFVRENIDKTNEESSVWNENNPGRIYMGIYAPGRGSMTPLVRLWASMFNISQINKDDDFIKYYWTIIGYFNAIRELGSGSALYREDIGDRLADFNSTRELKDKKVELSSRISSTEVPLLLDEIEMDGKRENNKTPEINALLTTSMFGTGVDVSHLSLMIVSGQPKTTGSYIQATGRIGRDHGGLVVTFLKGGKPRDLNHYETFPAYHHRLHLGIEPVSVSPFSEGAVIKGLGACLISFLRNSSNLKVKWTGKEDGLKILENGANDDINYFINFLEKRMKYIYDKNEEDIIWKSMNYLRNKADSWKNMARKANENNEKLLFYEYIHPKAKAEFHNVILGDAIHENREVDILFKNVPSSLRDIENTIGFWV